MRSGVLALIHGELVAQGEDFELQGSSRLEAGPERGDEGEEDCLHEVSKLPHLSGTRRESLACAMSRETSVMAVVSVISDGQSPGSVERWRSVPDARETYPQPSGLRRDDGAGSQVGAVCLDDPERHLRLLQCG